MHKVYGMTVNLFRSVNSSICTCVHYWCDLEFPPIMCACADQGQSEIFWITIAESLTLLVDSEKREIKAGRVVGY